MLSLCNIRRLLKFPKGTFHTSKTRTASTRTDEANAEKTFDKILIANRGEIACRVMRTCRDMGIRTVAVYSDADSQSLHTWMADEGVNVGPALATDSYLNMDAILRAIDKTGAQAVHPGYGFLSENQRFAERLAKQGVAFIGPKQHAIDVMGDKLASKRTAMKAQVNIIPGFDGIVKDAEEAVSLAREIGYPVMLKASAGGGGKGMRVAWNDDETRQGFVLAQEEAKTAVKDDRLLIEKFIDKPRHIEIQILADEQGNTIYLNERECSIQRRNQKVIEEAPSTFLDQDTRKAMGQQAVMLAKAVDYCSAGTVEFLVDSQKNFYFLEMNTRLQVEHPITECTTGVDIVKEMIRVAAGHPLSYTQEDIGINGWAVEARVYAEDPEKFLPSTGYLSTYIEPIGKAAGFDNVRIDTGIFEGSTISMYYDPMISKLITHGPTRQDALNSLAKALDYYTIRGVNHNIPLLRDIITQPQFVQGDITTKFIEEVYPNGFQGRVLTEMESKQLIAAACYMHVEREDASSSFVENDRYDVESELEDQVVIKELVVKLEDKLHKVKAISTFTGLKIQINNELVTIDTDWRLGSPLMKANINGQQVAVQFEKRNGQLLHLRHYGNKYSVLVLDSQQAELYSHMPEKSDVSVAHLVLAPMPGVVKTIHCAVGDEVEEGSTLMILEAMKMQMPLLAPMTGKIKEIKIKENDSVMDEDLLLEFELPQQTS
ncbi:propionyl-CoA carboxylase alpha chain, mitochondrial-like [Dysidea avara]|uniref:propionyl-CoA carboxylase alpha chain, mitochondrial-like n=1 Tax=Dysidea avara TaxID=196820 RepID=UPI00331D1B1E